MVEIKKNVNKLAGSITYGFYKHHYNQSVQANHQMNQEFDDLDEKEQDVWVATGQDSVDALMEIVMNIAQQMKDESSEISELSTISSLSEVEPEGLVQPEAPKKKPDDDVNFETE